MIINLLGNITVKRDDVRKRVFAMTVTGLEGEEEKKQLNYTLKN